MAGSLEHHGLVVGELGEIEERFLSKITVVFSVDNQSWNLRERREKMSFPETHRLNAHKV